jgi:hypothetical protein
MPDPARKTPSGQIGTILPVDSRTTGVFDINADELRGLFDELTQKTKNVTFFLDSCHSGLAFKDVAESRSVDPDLRGPPKARKCASAPKKLTAEKPKGAIQPRSRPLPRVELLADHSIDGFCGGSRC